MGSNGTNESSTSKDWNGFDEDTVKKKEAHEKPKRYIINDPTDSFDCSVLPEGWIRMRHESGLNIYLHRASRVVTLSRPYAVGPGSIRHHRVPVTAIPCLTMHRLRGRDLKMLNSAVTRCLVANDDRVPEQQEAISDEPAIAVLPSSSEFEVPSCVIEQNDTHDDLFDAKQSLCLGGKRKLMTEDDADKPVHNCLIESLSREEGELSSPDEDDNSILTDHRSSNLNREVLHDTVKLESEESNSTILTCPVVTSAASSVSESAETTTTLSNDVHESVGFASTIVSSNLVPLSGRRKRRRRYFGGYNRDGVKLTSHNNLSTTPLTNHTGQDERCVQDLNSVKAQVYSVKDRETESLVTSEEMRTYCSQLFDVSLEEFVLRRNARERQIDTPVATNDEPQKPLMLMPEQAKLIRYQISGDGAKSTSKHPKEGVINMTGKSYVCILHEYCQNVIRRPPTYQAIELTDDRCPYQMNVLIDGQVYSTGIGQSKKQARLEAARKALERLIPDFNKIASSDSRSYGPSVTSERDFALFESVSVTDPRLYELSVRAALPTPYNLLVECLHRSCIPESDLRSSMTSQGRSKHFFTLELHGETSKVPCKNKREGRHLAAQNILARLHPSVTSWSGMLHLYGPGSKPNKRGELDTIQDAQSQEKSAVKISLIRLLRTKMRELADQWEKNGCDHPKGKFNIPPCDNLPVVTFHADSLTDLYSSNPIVTSTDASDTPGSVTVFDSDSPLGDTIASVE